MYKVSALVAAGLMMVASPALAQSRAPITRGATSSQIAEDVGAAQRQNAELKVQMNGLLGDIMDLTGRIETLEYNLNRAKKANERLGTDNEALADELGSMSRQLGEQGRAISQLQAALGAAPEVAGSNDPRVTSGTIGVTRSTYPGATQPGAGTSATSGATNPSTQAETSGSEPQITRTTRTISSSGPTRIVRSGDVSSATTGQNSTATSTQAPRIETRATEPDDGTSLRELPTGTLGTIPASALPGQAGSLFAEAKSRYVRFDYAGAEEAFRKFIEAFGNDPQAGEAHYWLGEALYNQKAYAESGSAYTTMIRSYPDDPRAPDALVKLARTMRILGEDQRACLALDTFPKRYPNASGVARDLAAVERTKAGCGA